MKINPRQLKNDGWKMSFLLGACLFLGANYWRTVKFLGCINLQPYVVTGLLFHAAGPIGILEFYTPQFVESESNHRL